MIRLVQDTLEIKKELVNFLRNSDIISKANRGVTTRTDTGTYAGASTDTVDTNPTKLRNIRSIIVGGTTLKYGSEYTVNLNTGVITYISAQTGDYTLSYDTGAPDRIFPDFPQAKVNLASFPRIAVDIIGGDMEEVELGARTTLHDYNISIICYARKTRELEAMISAVMSNMLLNKKLFHYLKFITPEMLGPIVNNMNKGSKVIQRNIDFKSTFNYETVNV